MIEQINGPGLTGSTGKSGKQGKNSLFAKLFAMLDKNAEVSGKGKELQLDATGLAKGKTMIAASGKGDSLILEKGDPLATAKGKQLVALAVKGKLGSETLAEETATPLVTAHVIIDQPAFSKKANITGKATVLIAQQQTGSKGEQTASPALKQSQQAQVKVASSQFGEAVKAEQAIQTGNKPLTAASEGKPLAAASEGKPLAAASEGKPLAAASEGKPLASTKEAVVSDQLLKTADKSQTSTVTSKTAELGAHVQKPVINGQAPVSTQATLNTAEQRVEAPQLTEGQKVVATATASKSLGEKVAGQQPKAETINVAAGVQLQQGKHAPQAQSNGTTVAASTSVQANTSESLLSNSDSSSSDRGSQEGRTISALAGDAKSTGSASANNASFQSYLTSKTAPTLSPFDSMKHIAQSAANGQTKLEIQLDPANLGKIQITLQTDAAKNLQVHMIVDQGTTRAALEQQLPALRAALSQQGFDLSGFSMGSNGQKETFAEGGRNGSNNLADNGDNISTGNSSNSVQQQSTRSADGSLSIRV